MASSRNTISALRISDGVAAKTTLKARRGSRTPRAALRIAVLDRATGLLIALAQLGREATLNEVAQLSGLSKATAFRILATLTEHGFVEQDATTSSYRLGITPLRMATGVLDGIAVHTIARPVMRSISDMMNETVALSVRDGDFRVNVDAVECSNAIGSSRRIGEPRSLHAGAPSRVLLAAMPDDDITAYIKRHRLAGKPGGSPAYIDGLWKDIRKARRTGLVSMAAESLPESHAVATVIKGVNGEAVAALYVAIPRGRFSPRIEARCGQALLRAAADIQRELVQAEAKPQPDKS
jgi:DNA-binding IclR family transcriptional regulator